MQTSIQVPSTQSNASFFCLIFCLPDIGYVQGMNFVAAHIILQLGGERTSSLDRKGKGSWFQSARRAVLPSSNSVTRSSSLGREHGIELPSGMESEGWQKIQADAERAFWLFVAGNEPLCVNR